jgi:hypothetical protein
MNELGNKYAVAALRDQRARLSGEIAALKKQIAWKQGQLSHLDATLAIFEPGADPSAIPNKRPQKRVKLFRQGELGRLIIDALRRAEKPLQTQEIVTALIAETGHNESARAALMPRVRGNLAYLQKSGRVTKAGRGMSVTWALAT